VLASAVASAELRQKTATFSRPSMRMFASSAAAAAELRKTPLWDLHVARNAYMTEFGGWDMPLYYEDGIMKEHKHCRAEAGLFDVSHMVPINITGADRVAFAERVFPASIAELPAGQGCLTNMPNADGGLIDDCIITNAGEHLFLVINAGHEDKDLPHMEAILSESGLDAQINVIDSPGLLALQGPKAVSVLARLCDDDVDFQKFGFMTGRTMSVAGVECFVTRSGYTGEDGFELTVPTDEAEALAHRMLDQPEVKPIGLGARDSLRLEAGLCLYGNEMDDNTSPLEAGLLWTIGKRRRAEGGFCGADKILAEVADRKLVKRKLVGLNLTGKGPPPRSHDALLNEDGESIGEVTSGVFGPTVGQPVAMGYVEKAYAKKGTALKVQIRKKQFDMHVVGMPFTPSNFFRG
jgi:aminomethyltransferase